MLHRLRTRPRIGVDGTIAGHAPGALPIGEHDAEILLHTHRTASSPDAARVAIHALQDELARLPGLDPRSPEELLGYDETGLFG